MDYTEILRRSLHLAWRSKALWLFGALLSLTSRGGFSLPRGQFRWTPGRESLSSLSAEWRLWLIGGLCLLLLLGLIAVVLRYIAEVGLYRLIDEELTLNRPATIRRGFELGWDRRALRLFGIDLLIGIPLLLFILAVIVIVLSPLLLLLIDNTFARITAVVAAIGLGLVGLLVIIVIGAIVGVWRQIFARRAILDDRDWLASLREGYLLCIRRWEDVILMALLMWGIALLWGILLIPTALLLGALAFALGGGPAWLITTLTEARWLGLLIGVPIGLTVFLLPLAILQGAYQSFHATVWTIVYRELAPAVPLESPPAA